MRKRTYSDLENPEECLSAVSVSPTASPPPETLVQPQLQPPERDKRREKKAA
jgi:hypothetical protein